MLHKGLAALAAAAIMACAVLPADAAKKGKRYRAETRTTVSPSLDGRITGRSRTCGYATFQYDGLGVPYGPYCH